MTTTMMSVANNLPRAVQGIAKELRVSEEALTELLERLRADPERDYVPLMRVLDDLDELPELEEISDEQIESLRNAFEKEITSSVLSAQERADFTTYDALLDKNERQSAEALRIIRDRRLYREDYPTWDSYCLARRGFSGTTGDNRIAWLRMTEMIEVKLSRPIKLGVVEAKELLKLQDYPDLAAEALLAAQDKAEQEGHKRKTEDVAFEVKRRQDHAPLAEYMSLAEYEWLKAAGVGFDDCYDVIEDVRKQQAEGLSFEEALQKNSLVMEAKCIAELRQKKEALKSVQGEIKEITEQASLKQRREVEKKLKEELQALEGSNSEADVIQPDADAQVASSTLTVLSEDDEAAQAQSSIRDSLDDAAESINDAHNGDWNGLSVRELTAVIDRAQEIELALHEFIATVKAKFVDAGGE